VDPAGALASVASNVILPYGCARPLLYNKDTERGTSRETYAGVVYPNVVSKQFATHCETSMRSPACGVRLIVGACTVPTTVTVTVALESVVVPFLAASVNVPVPAAVPPVKLLVTVRMSPEFIVADVGDRVQLFAARLPLHAVTTNDTVTVCVPVFVAVNVVLPVLFALTVAVPPASLDRRTTIVLLSVGAATGVVAALFRGTVVACAERGAAIAGNQIAMDAARARCAGLKPESGRIRYMGGEERGGGSTHATTHALERTLYSHSTGQVRLAANACRRNGLAAC